MKRFLRAWTAAVALACAAGAAEAATVIYKFESVSFFGYSAFEYRSDGFIVSDFPVFPGDPGLTSCVAAGSACQLLAFNTNAFAGLDAIALLDSNFAGAGFGFEDGAFSKAGSYVGGSGETLTVGLAPVPEPAAWALMIGGFGLVGASLRRREVVSAA